MLVKKNAKYVKKIKLIFIDIIVITIIIEKNILFIFHPQNIC